MWQLIDLKNALRRFSCHIPISERNWVWKTLLGISSLVDKTTENARKHDDFLFFLHSVLDHYTISDVALIGESTSTNLAFLNMVQFLFCRMLLPPFQSCCKIRTWRIAKDYWKHLVLNKEPFLLHTVNFAFVRTQNQNDYYLILQGRAQSITGFNNTVHCFCCSGRSNLWELKNTSWPRKKKTLLIVF